jgi:hypothetical protein
MFSPWIQELLDRGVPIVDFRTDPPPAIQSFATGVLGGLLRAGGARPRVGQAQPEGAAVTATVKPGRKPPPPTRPKKKKQATNFGFGTDCGPGG